MLGIERLGRKINELEGKVDALAHQIGLLIDATNGHDGNNTKALKSLTTALTAGLQGVQTQMATRQQLDDAKAALGQAITDAANRVAADLQALRDQIANGQPVSDQDIADIQADVQQLAAIDPVAPAPTP